MQYWAEFPVLYSGSLLINSTFFLRSLGFFNKELAHHQIFAYPEIEFTQESWTNDWSQKKKSDMRIISWFPSKLHMTIIWIHRFKFICYVAFCCHLLLLTFKLFHLWLMETLLSWLLSSSDMTQWCLVDSLLEWQEFPCSSCVFPAPVLESAISLNSSGSF